MDLKEAGRIAAEGRPGRRGWNLRKGNCPRRGAAVLPASMKITDTQEALTEMSNELAFFGGRRSLLVAGCQRFRQLSTHFACDESLVFE